MRKFLLNSSALLVSGLLSSTAEAGCIQTPSCSSMGYSSTTACEGGLKCPFGNAWNCTLVNKITELEKIIEKNQAEEALKNCKIGDILYSDMSCNSNVVASKTPIGVVFDTTNTLAIAKDEFADMPWSYVGEDVARITNSSSNSSSTADWQGFNNTKAMYEADKSGVNYPAIKKVLTYSTTGTSQGQWYLPAAGELHAISTNKDTLNTTLSKIGGTQMSGNYWSSSEQNNLMGYWTTIGSGSSGAAGEKIVKYKAKPVINFGSKNKIDFAYVSSNETACSVGSILYSDKKCYAGSTPSGKTPIGIVFDVENRKATALESSPSKLSWGLYPMVVSGLDDDNGKSNTSIMLAFGKEKFNTYQAAEYAYNYTTAGTNVGDWYLPALGECEELGRHGDFWDYALSLIGNNKIKDGYHWTSSQLSASDAKITLIGSTGYSSDPVEYSNYVLPFIMF